MSEPQTRPRRADVRAGILAAAADAFLAGGYEATTVAEIAAAAGFTKGAVYSNFGGKPELFVAVFAERFSSITNTALLETELLTTDDSPHRAAATLAASLTDYSSDGTHWPAALAEFRGLALRDPAIGALYAELRIKQRTDLAAQLRQRADTLGLRDDLDFEVAATLLTTVINSLALEHAAASDGMPLQLMEATLRHVLEGLIR